MLSLRGMFEAMTDERVSFAMRRHEVAEAARAFDIPVDIRRIREIPLINALRCTMFELNCHRDIQIYNDTRWWKAANDEPIKIKLSPAANRSFGKHVMACLMWWQQETTDLKFEIVGFRERADVLIDFGEIDGDGHRLGVTTRVVEGPLERVKLPEGVSVHMMIDKAEKWFPEYFMTVFTHELGHMLGIDHLPRGNLMYRRYIGPVDKLGPQDIFEITDRYGIALAA